MQSIAVGTSELRGCEMRCTSEHLCVVSICSQLLVTHLNCVAVKCVAHLSKLVVSILTATPSAVGPFWLLGLLFAGLGASFLTLRGTILAPRDHPGGPWAQQHGFEVVVYRIFINLGGGFGTRVY